VWPTLLPLFGKLDDEQVGLLLVERLQQLVERGAWTLSDAQARAVLGRYPPTVHARAERLYAAIARQREQQQARLAAWKPLLASGDPPAGREVFFGKQVACGACHRVQGVGGEVGPDLTRIGAVRSVDDLLESIVLPSATFAQGYQTYAVTTVDGRIATGVIARQRSDQEADWEPSHGLLVLREASGKEHRFRHQEIDELSRSSISLMPEGLLQKLEPRQVQDLFAFLRSLK
jgi:putative heme-binding domain-containing protein